MPPARKKTSKKRRWKLITALGAIVLGGLVAGPFVFTTPIARYYIDHSIYRRFGLRFKTARLHPLGGVTLDEVTAEDVGENAGKPLLQADHVRLDFGWTDIFSPRYRALDAQNVRLTLRPAADLPASLLRLIPQRSPGGPGASGSAGRGAAWDFLRQLPALPVDQIFISGSLHIEDFRPWPQVLELTRGETMPFRIVMANAGDPAGASSDVAMVVGNADSPLAMTEPVAAGRVHISTVRDHDTLVVIDALSLSNLSADLSRNLFPAWDVVPAGRTFTTHADRISLTGTLALGSDAVLNGALELRDFSLRNTDDGPGVTLDHLSLTSRVAGALSANPLRDLAFSKTRIDCDLAQYDVWRATHIAAGIQVAGPEVQVVDLEASALDGTLTGSAAWDMNTQIPSQANFTLQGASVQRLLSRLTESTQQALPLEAEGDFTLRASLSDSPSDHLAGRVDLIFPGQLKVRRVSDLRTAASPPYAGGPADAPQNISIDHLAVGANVTWSGVRTDLPDISRGRLTMDDLSFALPALPGSERTIPVDAKAITADFDMSRGAVRLAYLSAVLNGVAQLLATGRCEVNGGALDGCTLSLNHIDGGELSALLPGGWAIAGQFALTADLAGQLTAPILTARLTGSAQTSIRVPPPVDGTIEINGKPTLSLRASAEAGSSLVQIDSVSLRGLSTVKVDRAVLQYLHQQAVSRDGDSSVAARLLDRLHEGINGSFVELAARGRLNLAGTRTFDGSVVLIDLDAAAGAEPGNAAQLDGLSVRASVALACNPGDAWNSLQVRDGEISVDRLQLDESILSGGAAKFSITPGELTVPDVAFSFADGTFHGNAAFAWAGGLDRLHLRFTGLNESLLSANLLPTRFGAQGSTSGAVDLAAEPAGALRGTIELDAPTEGRLTFSKETVWGSLSAAARNTAAEVAASGATLPSNFEQIVTGDLGNYRYVSGHASLADTPDGLELTLDYARAPIRPEDAGYGAQVTIGGHETSANLTVNLRNITLDVPDYTVAEVLGKALGFSDFLQGPAALTQPSTAPATAP